MKTVYFLAITLWLILGTANADLDFNYHSYTSIVSTLNAYKAQFPDKVYLYSIGKSVQNRDMLVIAIADSQPDKHITLRPEAKYIGNMHGNEVPSKEILLHLIDYMLNNQSADPSVDYVMKNTRLHLLVTMNPDGLEMSTVGDCSSVQGRYNANGFDLNRNFPDLFMCNTATHQPETQAVMNWLESTQFVLSANFHGGAVVANYPYDNTANGDSVYSLSNDNDVFISLAKNYSYNNLAMRSYLCGDSFADGITNGGECI